MGLNERREALLGLLEDDDEATRESASKALESLDAAQSYPHLITLLGDADPSQNIRAIYGLARIHTEQASSLLIGLARNDREDIRSAAIRAMIERQDTRFAQPIMDAIEDPSPSVRALAVAGVGRLRERRAIPALIGAIKTSDEETRVAIIQTLGLLGDARAEAVLLQGVRHKNPRIRRASAASIALLDLDEPAAG